MASGKATTAVVVAGDITTPVAQPGVLPEAAGSAATNLRWFQKGERIAAAPAES